MESITLDVLRLPSNITAAPPSMALGGTNSEAEVAAGVNSLNLLTGGYKFTPRDSNKPGFTALRSLRGLPYIARYPPTPDNGALGGRRLPYYRTERTSTRYMDASLGDSVAPDLPASIFRLGKEMIQAGVPHSLFRTAVQLPLPGLLAPRVVLVSPSGYGKTTLLNVIAHRGQLPTATIRAACAKHQPNGIARLIEPAADDTAAAAPAELPTFEALGNGAEFSLPEFEAKVMGGPWYQKTLAAIIQQATKRASRTGDDKVALAYRGPSIAIPHNTDASSYVPSTMEKSPDDLFRLIVPFLSADDVAKATAAARSAFDALRAESDGAGPSAGPAAATTSTSDDGLRLIRMGQDMYGFEDDEECTTRQPPSRLKGKPTSEWTLRAELQPFVGKTLEVCVNANDWEHGCAQLHDLQLVYTRDEAGPWALIKPEGITLQLPSNIIRFMDMQGALNDDSARDCNLTHVLAKLAPEIHAYVLPIKKQVEPAVKERLQHIVEAALNREAEATQLAATGAVLEATPPPRIFMLRIVDTMQDSGELSQAELLDKTTDPLATAEGRDSVEKDLRKAGRLAFRGHVEDAESFKHLQCHAVAAMRMPCHGLEAFERALVESHKRTVDAVCNSMASNLLEGGKKALAVSQAVQQRTAARSTADADADARLLNEEKAHLVLLLTQSVPCYEAPNEQYSKLELLVETVLQTSVVEPVQKELRLLLDAAQGDATEEGLRVALNAVGLGPANEDDKNVVDAQLAHLRTTGRDSKVLSAILQPCLTALVKFSSVTLVKFADRPALADELTEKVLGEILTPAMREMLASCEVDGGISPKHPESWLFVQRVRCHVSKQVSTLCAHLSAITFPDLEEAAFCCGSAAEHFAQAAAIVLDPKVGGTARTREKFKVRNDVLASLYLDTVRNDNTVEQGLLPRINTALLNAIWTYYWDVCPMVAEELKDSLHKCCGADAADDMDAVEGLLTLPNAASPAASNKRKHMGDPTSSSGKDQSSRIRDILGKLEDLLRSHGLMGAGVAVGAGGHSRGGLLDSVVVELNARLRRRMDTRALSVQSKPRSALEKRQEELWTYTLGQLKDVIHDRGLTITQRKPAKTSLIKLIIDHEFPAIAKNGRASASAARGGAAM